jgi:ArsR family transcriptional regulator, arsenate/arsenite/antimonite-responsive transcriptional repressor
MKRAVAPKLAVVGHIGPAPSSGNLSPEHALAALAALGQPTRLHIFRLLVRGAPDGLAAGSIAATINCPNNTLSSHLAILARAGLVHGARDGRSIVYRADLDGMRALVGFLLTDCCNGHPGVCKPISSIIDSACGCPVLGKEGGSDARRK